MENRITSQFTTPLASAYDNDDTTQPTVEDLIIIEDEEAFLELGSSLNQYENSSNSELVNDFRSYLNQILYNYYDNPNRNRGYTSGSSLRSSISQTQQIIDLNFGVYKSFGDASSSMIASSSSSFPRPLGNDDQLLRQQSNGRSRHSVITRNSLEHILREESCLLKDASNIIDGGKSSTNNDPDFIIDHQGIFWRNQAQREMMFQSRQLDLKNFFNIQDSCQKSKQNINTSLTYYTSPSAISYTNASSTIPSSSAFFSFKNFFKNAKPYLVHFQLRNLVASGCDNSVIVSDYNAVSQLDQYLHGNTLKGTTRGFEIKQLSPQTGSVDVLIDQSKLKNSFNQHIKISTLSANQDLVAAGSYTGDYLLYNNQTKDIYQDILTTNANGIINVVQLVPSTSPKSITSSVLFATNDSYLRNFNLEKQVLSNYRFPFPINSLSLNPSNPDLKLIVGDCLESFIIDGRVSHKQPILKFSNHHDYSFSCDWSKFNENLVVTGNQDGTVVLNDLRKIIVRPQDADCGVSSGTRTDQPFTANELLDANQKKCYIGEWEDAACFSTFSSDLTNNNNSVRNVRFSNSRNFLFFGETVDNVNVINLDDLTSFGEPISGAPTMSNYTYDAYCFDDYGSGSFSESSSAHIPRSYSNSNNSSSRSKYTVSGQCIQTFGKISGLCVNDCEDGNGEVLTIGISDESVGGILQYEYESGSKCLDFDFF
ncbi:hypothetical protein DASC09_053410 [Saccharomycopsis crataegensis]|uniref:Uncharacterized protein n=1 Tax=Saccharomycopsis crataegensis TaxID=43959 RepID=A0AAV5QU25_9ASCO|nr:hypothetical protein DASC09_053410 [Saccharomycopsis crataegensis]